jgi:hypothetical protein
MRKQREAASPSVCNDHHIIANAELDPWHTCISGSSVLSISAERAELHHDRVGSEAVHGKLGNILRDFARVVCDLCLFSQWL